MSNNVARRAFAPQQPSRYDGALEMWVPTMDLTPAEKFGQVVILMPPGLSNAHTAPIVAAMRERMENYNEEDALIAVGDPSLIAAAACIAARKTGGLLRMLKWDRHARDYILTEMRV